MVTGYMPLPRPIAHAHKCPFDRQWVDCPGCDEPWQEVRYCTPRCLTDSYFANCLHKQRARQADAEQAPC
jgi:hypothetical protein